jgi:hypothetical protein
MSTGMESYKGCRMSDFLRFCQRFEVFVSKMRSEPLRGALGRRRDKYPANEEFSPSQVARVEIAPCPGSAGRRTGVGIHG